MSEATFNFLLQTLLDEIEMHSHQEELIQLLIEQIKEDTYRNVSTDTTYLQGAG